MGVIMRFGIFLRIWRDLTKLAWRAAFAPNVTYQQSINGFTVHINEDQRP